MLVLILTIMILIEVMHNEIWNENAELQEVISCKDNR